MSVEKDSPPVLQKLSNLRKFVDVALAGIHTTKDAAQNVELHRRIAEVLRRPDPFSSEEDFQKSREEAKAVEDFAKNELVRGFPYLFSLATVRLWSILEVFIDDLVLELLIRSDLQYPSDSLLLKLEGALLPFVNSSQLERAERISLALKQKLDTAFKPGVARFEALLEPFGLAAKVDDVVKRVLMELSSTRNVIVHRDGIIDRRFVDACPWLGWVPGKELILTRNHFELYWFAASWYALDIEFRVDERLEGGANKEDYEKTSAAVLSAIKRFVQNRPRGV